MGRNKFIAGLDIGTSKIAAIIGGVNENLRVEIIGFATVPSEGIREGVVVNLDRTVKSIEKAVEEAEKQANVNVESLCVGIGGGCIRSQPSKGVIAISRSDTEITSRDVNRVIEQARAIPLPLEQEVIHVLPQKFIIDDQHGILDPLGMNGVRLETEVFIVSGTSTFLQNMIRCVNKAGFKIESLVFGPLASSEAVLLPDEKSLGVVLVDIGAGKSDITIFIENGLSYTSSIPYGGDSITRDIAYGLKTSIPEAEELKKKSGCAFVDMVKEKETIVVSSVSRRNSRKVTRRSLNEIIEPRIEEILGLVGTEIQKSGYAELLPAGVVMTGGTSMMNGLEDLAKEILGLDVRVGLPCNVENLSDELMDPSYALAIGLIQKGFNDESVPYKIISRKSPAWFKRVMGPVSKLFEEVF
ncbi:MAG: cell division protein FtsA [bacterium]